MHSDVDVTTEALEVIKKRWNGPLGAYPESGYFTMPNWQFVDVIEPAELVSLAKGWVDQGVTIPRLLLRLWPRSHQGSPRRGSVHAPGGGRGARREPPSEGLAHRLLGQQPWRPFSIFPRAGRAPSRFSRTVSVAPRIMCATSSVSCALCDLGFGVLRFDFTGLGGATIGAPGGPRHLEKLFVGVEPVLAEKGEAEVNLGGKPFMIRQQFVDDLGKHDHLLSRIRDMKKALMVFHAARDQIVGVENATAIFQAARHPKSFVSLDDADHPDRPHAKVHAADCTECETTLGKVDIIERGITLTGDLDDEQRCRLMEIAERGPVHQTLTTETITRDIAARITQHRSGNPGNFTTHYSIVRLVYVEFYERMTEAIQREKRVKKWKCAWIIALIEQDNPDWDGLYLTKPWQENLSWMVRPSRAMTGR